MSRLYQPLNLERREIRLLRLTADNGPLPGNIKCELATFALQDEPHYTALSYCWGNEDAKHLIKVNEQPFHVRANLFAYLQLRQQEQDRDWIYIDAICINQADIDERSNQVSFMGEVYENATTVTAWLGKVEDLPFEAFETVAKALHDFEKTDGGLEGVAPASTPTIDYVLATLRDMSRIESRLDFQSRLMLYAEYWSRLWIVQEIALARQVALRLGDWRVSGYVFTQVLEFLFGSVKMEQFDYGVDILNLRSLATARLPKDSRGRKSQPKEPDWYWQRAVFVATMRAQLKQSGGRTPFYLAVIWLCSHQCAKIHDKVYGLLAMTSATHMPIAYRMPADELFIRAFLTGAIEILRDERYRNDPEFMLGRFHLALTSALDMAPLEPTTILMTNAILSLELPVGDDTSLSGLGLQCVWSTLNFRRGIIRHEKADGRLSSLIYRKISPYWLLAFYTARLELTCPLAEPLARPSHTPTKVIAPLLRASMRTCIRPAQYDEYARYSELVPRIFEEMYNRR